MYIWSEHQQRKAAKLHVQEFKITEQSERKNYLFKSLKKKTTEIKYAKFKNYMEVET